MLFYHTILDNSMEASFAAIQTYISKREFETSVIQPLFTKQVT